ncbi:MAG: hypothetical protein ACREA3_09575 [Nitrosotalea sp.]
MTTTAWKCYMCNLTFKEKSHASIHNEVSRHSAIEVKMAVA